MLYEMSMKIHMAFIKMSYEFRGHICHRLFEDIEIDDSINYLLKTRSS